MLDGIDVRVAPGPVEYDPCGGIDTAAFVVRAIVGLAGDEHAENTLDELIQPEGARSIKALLEADHDLGGLVVDTAVTRCTGWQLFRQGEHDALGATWTVNTLN